MSVIDAQTNTYGPATVPIQLEQGADFAVGITLATGVDIAHQAPMDLTGATITAYFSSTRNGVTSKIILPVSIVDAVAGKLSITFPAASTLALDVSGRPAMDALAYRLGRWILTVAPANGVAFRAMEGDVMLDRDPCRM